MNLKSEISIFINMTDQTAIKYVLLHADSIMPTRGTDGSVGYDLYSYLDITILPGKRQIIGTGIAIEMPKPTSNIMIGAKIVSRSGLAKKCIDVVAGLIDNDYRGEIKVMLFNSDIVEFHIEKNMRIAQLVFHQFLVPELIECEQLSETQRGAGGFGSTGV